MEVLFESSVNENELTALDFDVEQLIKDVVLKSLQYENFTTNVEVSISIVSNEEIQELNKNYRNKDYATDVLSFPLLSDFNINDDNIVAIGDIVISLEKAKEQAKEYGHSIKREVGFLTAHSMLHLLGYDHMEENEAKIMFEKQEEILNTLNLVR